MYILKEYIEEHNWISQVILSIQDKIAKLNSKQNINLGLSGGSTPYPIYNHFNKLDIDWSLVNLICLDERLVNEDSVYSNWRNIKGSIGENVLSNINSIARFEYREDNVEQEILKLENKLPDKMHITILGMGEDGHFASLFPNNKYLNLASTKVIQTEAPEYLDIKRRVSLSAKYIFNSDYLIILLRGKNKRKSLDRLLDGDPKTDVFPAKMLLKHDNLEIHYLDI